MIRGENLEISEGLKKLAEENQENLPNYLEAEGYDTVLFVSELFYDATLTCCSYSGTFHTACILPFS